MTIERSTVDGHEINSADARRRQIRVAQLVFAGAATVATLALCSAARPGDAETASASPVGASYGSGLPQAAPSAGGAGGHIIAVNDDSPNNPSSGDIFLQNALDQSTASGAGT